MNEESAPANQMWHRSMGPLIAELKVSRLVYYTTWFGAFLFGLFAGMFFLFAIFTQDPLLILVGIFVSLFAFPFWLVGRWLRRNEIECYEEGIVTYRLFRKETLRFDETASFSSAIRRESAVRSTKSGRQTHYYDVAYLDFLPSDPERQPIRYRTQMYPRDKRLARIIEYCSRRMSGQKQRDTEHTSEG